MMDGVAQTHFSSLSLSLNSVSVQKVRDLIHNIGSQRERERKRKTERERERGEY